VPAAQERGGVRRGAPDLSGQERAQLFRRLHREPPILVLANAWDVASARIVERAGARAVATSSAAVCWALGYRDGEEIPRDEMLEWVGRIARAVELPVTADLEAGYGDPVATGADVWARGAVGLNVEDASDAGLAPLDEQVAAVRELRRAVPELVINARTDVLLRGLGTLDEAIERANSYLAAGADCAFVPGVSDRDTIARLARAIEGPLNVLAVQGTPPAPELQSLGVARVSAGSGIARAAYRRTEQLAREMLEAGTFGFADDAFAHADLQAILARENG
jgi:2-methylisocitrate lyase-like PEP mutase family enzyme